MLVPFRGNGLSFGNPNFSFGDPITSSKGAIANALYVLTFIAADGLEYILTFDDAESVENIAVGAI